MTDIELLPCPFCGGKVELTSRDGETPWDEIGIIFCPGCNSKYENTLEYWNPAKTWNRRAHGSKPDQETANPQDKGE